LFAHPARGLFMGNRGGRLHDDKQHLGTRRWVSKQWICCVLDFKNRRRTVWGDSYTELFFLDEVTALAAGHRPCFECRRRDAMAFAQAWSADDRKPSAAEMDRVLHNERLKGREKRMHCASLDDLPDGAMILCDGATYAVRGDALLSWSPAGYVARASRGRDTTVDVLTPPAILNVLSSGYQPHWHPSAADCVEGNQL